MSELWMFIVTVVGSIVWLAVAPFLLPKADRACLRAGLWLNGIQRAEADEIIKWYERKNR